MELNTIVDFSHCTLTSIKTSNFTIHDLGMTMMVPYILRSSTIGFPISILHSPRLTGPL